MKLKKFLVLTAGLLVLANLSLAAEVSQDIEIILDASGSMMAKIGKETRIDIAKRVLIDLVESLKDRTDLALAIRAYGHQSHRDKKDCKDTKLEISFGKPDPAEAKALMKEIKAQGWTPIAYSLLEAKKDFDLKAKRRRTIILITDGLESCDGDPCKVAKEFAKPDVNIVIHVIGFDLKKTEIAQLECIVKPSGGMLLSARDADQLKKALGEAIKRSLGGAIKITALRNKVPIKAWAEAFKPGEEEAITGSGIQPDKPGEIVLTPGTYDIKVTDINIETEPTVTLSGIKIESGKTIEKTVDFSGGVLIVTIIKNGKPSEGRANVLQPDGEEVIDKWIEIDKPAKFELVPGSYDIMVEDTNTDMGKYPTMTFKGVKIIPGETLEKVAKFSGGFLKVRILKDGKQIEGTATINLANTAERVSWKDTEEEEWTIFKLSPGAYDIEIEDDDGNKKLFMGIKINAETTETIEAKF
jgi:Ca-activated chloride channel family protein